MFIKYRGPIGERERTEIFVVIRIEFDISFKRKIIFIMIQNL